MNRKYFYIIMSQFDLLENQVIEEVIRERTNYYINRNNPLNFWVLMSPNFLLKDDLYSKIKMTNFYKFKREELIYNTKFYNAVILSTDIEYINWLKLRLGYFENIENDIIDDKYRSDGIFGELTLSESSLHSLFETNEMNIQPKILLSLYGESYEQIINLL